MNKNEFYLTNRSQSTIQVRRILVLVKRHLRINQPHKPLERCQGKKDEKNLVLKEIFLLFLNKSPRQVLYNNESVYNLEELNEQKYTCNFCYKEFLQKSKYEIHLRIHNGDRPFKCEICPKAFRLLLTLDFDHLAN